MESHNGHISGLILIGAIATMIIGIFVGYIISSPQNNDINHSYVTPTPTPALKTYDGYCTISGTYRKRAVSCTGNYDPEAKARAEVKAKECNESSRPVRGCTDTYR